MKHITHDTQQARKFLTQGNTTAAIKILLDADQHWKTELQRAADHSEKDTAIAAEAYIIGKRFLLKLLLEKGHSPIQVDPLYTELCVMAAENNVQLDVIQEYATLLEAQERFSCQQEALGNLYILLAQHFENETFRTDMSSAYAELALNCFRALDMSAEIAFACALLAQITKEIGRWEGAIPLFSEAITRYRQLVKEDSQTYDLHLARCMQNQANILRYIGNKEDAKNLYREAISIWRDHADFAANQVCLAKANHSLAEMLGNSPDEDAEAIDLLHEAVELIRHGRLAQRCADNLCFRLRCNGRTEEADRIEQQVYSA